eukprot:TRINITY_DN2554_c0_g1_i1.p1 TRINITY_DN2554_c0_g1~~TRINITY_DN2554_c0_g1_i1.p1  ORF type:complete len:189 (+),score=37.72 TRINITY_DN2554_c0_g1_i1:103-669(+)
MVAISINVLPIIATVLLIIPFIFLIVGASGDNKGWMKVGSGGTLGWRGACGGNTCYNYADVGGSNDYNDRLKNGGNCAGAGSIIGILFVFVAFIVGIIASLGGLGFYRILCIVAAVLTGVACFVVTLMWIVWAGVTAKIRDDNSDVKIDYCFGLEVVATFFMLVSTIIFVVSIFIPVRVKEMGSAGQN